MDEFIKQLIQVERTTVTDVMAFMSYNPAIGRVLERGGVKKFQRLAGKLADELSRVGGIGSFDRLHEKYARRLIANFETARGSTLSYGQAQKPLNVFLKVFVDWAARPTRTIRSRLLPCLHVPLDSVLMEEVRRQYRVWYDGNIEPHIADKGQRFSLANINKWQYDKWQLFFRRKHPAKPLLFDVLWAQGR